MEYDSRHLRIDIEFVKNMPADLLAELITFDDVIPDGINGQLRHWNKTFCEERGKVTNYKIEDPEYYEKKLDMRYGWRPDDFEQRDDDINLMDEEDIRQACEFLIQYPKYKCLLKSILYYTFNKEDTLDLVYEQPFEEYLEEYIKSKESNN